MDPLTLESAALSADGRSLVILDQTLLPGEVRYLSLTETEDIVEAIRALRVRGAPAIGVAAAYGLYLAAQRLDAEDMDQFLSGLRRAAETPLRDCRVPSSRLGPLDWSRSRADLTAALKPVRASAAPSTTAAVSVTACWSAGS